jgi:ABC-type lipoprotein export system ATPase subunit
VSAVRPVVRCEGAARTFGTGRGAVVALQPTTCEIFPGARIALTGPSGSGKSTLVHLLAGLDDPSLGSVTWPAIGPRSALRPGPVGVVFHGPSLLSPLTVVENVALPLLLAGRSEADAVVRAGAALERLELEPLQAKLPEEISGGQAQRVAVARALTGAPLLLLADEPTGQLDHENAAEVIYVLEQAARDSGAALVVATHDPEVAERLPERWVMRDGRVAFATTHRAWQS